MHRSKVAAMVAGLLGLVACSRAPDRAELERLRREAQAENARLLSLRRASAPRRDDFQLAIEGQIRGARRVLSRTQLEALAETHVRADKRHLPDAPGAWVDFRGVLVRRLLELADAAPEASEVTFLASDAYRSTVAVADVRAFDVMLALAQGGRPLLPSEGGPLFLVFPDVDHPEIDQRYPAETWVWAVTHLIVGTEPLRLAVGGRVLDRAALQALPQTTLVGPVALRNGWPPGSMALSGVLLRDLLAHTPAAGPATLPLRIRSKVSGPGGTHELDPTLPARCPVLIATRMGADERPISARFGGPALLAFGPACPRTETWMTFVEAIELGAP